jgi:hypothetical protein
VASIPTLTLRDGEVVPRLGMGTWHMGERASNRGAEVEALRLGLDHGMNLVDNRRDVRRRRRGKRGGRSDPRLARGRLRGDEVLSAPRLAAKAHRRV